MPTSHRAAIRPEWGLANNAAFVAAPRSRTENIKLDGRVFFHDYDYRFDPDSKVLALILCAPVVVASWINLQYYASTVDPTRYGSGNKVLHNIVGGLGAFEGNGGDLKTGLPLQLIHDVARFVHEPRRLTVYIDAPPSNVTAVLEGNPSEAVVRARMDSSFCLGGERASWILRRLLAEGLNGIQVAQAPIRGNRPVKGAVSLHLSHSMKKRRSLFCVEFGEDIAVATSGVVVNRIDAGSEGRQEMLRAAQRLLARARHDKLVN